MPHLGNRFTKSWYGKVRCGTHGNKASLILNQYVCHECDWDTIRNPPHYLDLDWWCSEALKEGKSVVILPMNVYRKVLNGQMPSTKKCVSAKHDYGNLRILFLLGEV